MAIPSWTECDYVAEYDASGFEPDAICLHARSRVESAESVLVGHRPRIRFWCDVVSLEASDTSRAAFHRVAFPVGDAVFLAAQAADTLNLTRTASSGFALSILRGGQLVLALGAVTTVSLGVALSATNGFTGNESWLEVSGRNDGRCHLRERESGHLYGYEIYLERARPPHLFGPAECASIALAASGRVANAARRGAVLLGGSRCAIPKWQTWDGRIV